MDIDRWLDMCIYQNCDKLTKNNRGSYCCFHTSFQKRKNEIENNPYFLNIKNQLKNDSQKLELFQKKIIDNWYTRIYPSVRVEEKYIDDILYIIY